MAELVTVEGQQFKKRSPWGAWGLLFVTFGIYGLVWYYKINDEARRFLRDETIKPILSLLAMFVPIVNLVSFYRTGQRIVRMEERMGVDKTVEPILGLIAGYIASLHIPYYQGHLNGVWDRAMASQLAAQPYPPAMVPAPPPPPAPPVQ